MDIFYWWSIFYWWLLISCELVFTFHKITYAWFAMAERLRESVCEREKDRDRKLPHWRKLLQGKFWRFFFKISSLFPYEMFSWPKLFIPDEKIFCWKFCPTNTISEDTLIYVKKSLKNDICIEICIKMHFNHCFTI